MCSNGSTYAERYAERMARYEERMARQEERRLAAVDECTRRSMAYCNNAMKKYGTYNYEVPAQNWELKAEYQCTIPKWKQKKMDKAAAKAAAAAEQRERPASPASSMTSSSEESLATTTRSKRSFSDKFRGFFRKDKKRSDSREFDGPEPVWDEPEPYELPPPKGYADDQEEDHRPQVIRRDTAMRAELEPESESEPERDEPPVNIARPLPPQPTGSSAAGPSSSMHAEHDEDAHPERPPPSYMEATSSGAYTQH